MLALAPIAETSIYAGLENDLSETRVRLSRRHRLLETFDTDIALDWATGSLMANAESGAASLRIAEQIAF